MEKQLYVLAGFDDRTARRLSGWESLLEDEGYHGAQTRGIPPHITLGMFPSEAEEQVSMLVARTAKEAVPFPVVFNHLGIFGGGRVLFAAPDVDLPLLHLKERFGPAHGWTAHATLLIDEPERTVAALPSVLKVFESFEGHIERLYLYEFFPSRLILDVPLEGRN